MAKAIKFDATELPLPTPGYTCSLAALATWGAGESAPYSVWGSVRNSGGTYVDSVQLTPMTSSLTSPMKFRGTLTVPSNVTSPVKICLAAGTMSRTYWCPSIGQSFDDNPDDPPTPDGDGEPPTPPPPLSPVEPAGPA
jgi:hypothetical protein